MPRIRKPQALHIIHGTERARDKQRRKKELCLKGGSVGECPSWINPEGREEWNRLTSDPDYSPVLAPAMRGTMIDYCNLYGRMIRHERQLPEWVDGRESQEIVNENGSIIPPLVEKLSASQRQTLHSMRMQLGLTPASQSKVKITKPVERENAFAGF
jgi:P27 family predicted phage terminase small subunit